MVNQQQTWGYFEGGSNPPVNSLSLWNSDLKTLPQPGSVVARPFRSNVIHEISKRNRGGTSFKCGQILILSDKPQRETPHSKEKRGEGEVKPALSAMLTPSVTFEKLKTGDRNVLSHRFISKKLKGLWPDPHLNLGNGCVHVVWMKRSVQSGCNKPRHVVVFAKQALIADAAPVFLRFAWPAVAFQTIRLCRVFTAAREEITGWLEPMWTVLRGRTPLSSSLVSFLRDWPLGDYLWKTSLPKQL